MLQSITAWFFSPPPSADLARDLAAADPRLRHAVPGAGRPLPVCVRRRREGAASLPGAQELCGELRQHLRYLDGEAVGLWRKHPGGPFLRTPSLFKTLFIHSPVKLPTLAHLLMPVCLSAGCQDSCSLPEGASTPALGLSNKAVFQGESSAPHLHV